MANFEKTTLMPVTSDELFAWHERPGALERLIPPWERVLIERKDPGLQKGSEVQLKTRIGPFWIRWLARHISYIPGKEFVDIQVNGPFAKWEHHHKMIEAQEGSAYLKDAITYPAT